jgi:hypothetical protein
MISIDSESIKISGKEANFNSVIYYPRVRGIVLMRIAIKNANSEYPYNTFAFTDDSKINSEMFS